jgi:hypothetical protein
MGLFLNISQYLALALIYILQIEPMACALRGDSDIKGVKLPGEGDIDSLETKLYMFADDDTQIINKDEDSLKKSFDVLSTYEKASGSKIKFDKTKGLHIGSARNRRPTFTKIK